MGHTRHLAAIRLRTVERGLGLARRKAEQVLRLAHEQQFAGRGTGRIEKIDADEITLSHGPIPSLQWGPMTMGFKPPVGGVPKNVAVGDRVAFEIRQTPDGMYQITAITPAAEAPGAAK